MPLKDYTTSINVYKTLAEIQMTLVKHGARKIVTDYDVGGKITSLSFLVTTPAGELPIRLPVNADKVLATLTKQRVRCDEDQAERTAWRILKDWTDAQMAILESEMVTMDQVMLPYVLQGERTVYELFQERRQRLTGGDEENGE